MKRGYVKLWRKMEESRLWSRGATTIGVAVVLVMRANHRPGWFAGREIRRGQLALGQEAFASELGLSRSQLRRILGNLVNDGFCSAIPASRYTLVTIYKYDTYQSRVEAEQPSDDTSHGTGDDTSHGTGDDAPRNQRPATNKNDKNDKKCVSRARVREGCSQVVDNRSPGTGKAGTGSAFDSALTGFAVPPDAATVREWALAHGRYIDADRFVSHWQAEGWKRNGRPVVDWRPLARLWRDDRDPACEGWNRAFGAARRRLAEVIRDQGRMHPGQATEIVGQVRGEVGVFYRPGDREGEDAALLGARAAAEAWRVGPQGNTDL